MVGHVTDLNAGNPLDGATVTNEAGESATTAPTPDDPALDDGFYWMFSSGPVSRSSPPAAVATPATPRTVNVVADAVTEASFALGVGQLEVTPSEIEAEVHRGQTRQAAGHLHQHRYRRGGGGADRARGDFEILGGGADGPTGEVRNLPGVFSTGASPSSGPSWVVGTPGHSAGCPWETIPDYPVSIMDNAAVELDGVVYSFGGYISGAVANAYGYDTSHR